MLSDFLKAFDISPAVVWLVMAGAVFIGYSLLQKKFPGLTIAGLWDKAVAAVKRTPLAPASDTDSVRTEMIDPIPALIKAKKWKTLAKTIEAIQEYDAEAKP